MSTSTPLPFELHADFAAQLPFMARPAAGEEQPDPQLVVLNEPLAKELGLPIEFLRSAEGIQFLLGRNNPPGQPPCAMAYSGHQFGQLNPYMGDGRALLLGEVTDSHGNLVDIHIKGSGTTPLTHPGADGRGTLSSMLREYLISHAMHAMGISTTQPLAVIATGRKILRTRVEPAAVHVRVATSHLRIGSFQYAHINGGETATKAVAEYTITRHYPHLHEVPPAERYAALLKEVIARQCATVAAWQRLGFIHGVMNTDNTSISGQTIDYGPCAFMESYKPETFFSSIDQGGRYAFGNQPSILGWNLTRLAETFLPLLAQDPNEGMTIAQGIINEFPHAYESAFTAEMAAALGLPADHPRAGEFTRAYTDALTEHAPDITNTNRALVDAARGDRSAIDAVLPGTPFIDEWLACSPDATAMDAIHPLVIPRNLAVDAALKEATDCRLTAFNALLAATGKPFYFPEDPELATTLTTPDPGELMGFRTFCGT